MESFITSVLAFIVAIAVLVTVHEWGHFIVARFFDVKVIRFSIGFGRPLVRYTGKKDNTEYVIAAIPLGGYVKMLGEGGADEPVAAHEQHRAFAQKPVLQRFAIVFAGPFINFVFAVLAFAMMYMIGVEGVKPKLGKMLENSLAWQSGLRAGDEIIAIEQQPINDMGQLYEELLPYFIDRQDVVLQLKNAPAVTLKLSTIPAEIEADDMHQYLGLQLYVPEIKAVIGKVFPDTPAQRAGLRIDDEILAIDDRAITGWIDLVHYVMQRPQQNMSLTVKRGQQVLRIDLKSTSDRRNGKKVGILGIANKYRATLPADMLLINRYGLWESLLMGVEKTWKMSVLTLKVFGKMIVGEASLKHISGPITIAEVAGNSYQQGIVYFLKFLAVISLSLGIINLLPIPMLDGGHLMFYLVEMMKGSPVSETVREFSLKIGVFVLVMLMGIAFFNDINRLVL